MLNSLKVLKLYFQKVLHMLIRRKPDKHLIWADWESIPFSFHVNWYVDTLPGKTIRPRRLRMTVDIDAKRLDECFKEFCLQAKSMESRNSSLATSDQFHLERFILWLLHRGLDILAAKVRNRTW